MPLWFMLCVKTILMERNTHTEKLSNIFYRKGTQDSLKTKLTNFFYRRGSKVRETKDDLKTISA